MSLKTSFYDGLTGLHQQLNNAFDAGGQLVTDSLATITTELQAAAAAGKITFTVNLITSYQTANLRLNGLLLKAYLAGVTQALAAEDIYSYEVTPALNTSSNTDTSIDLKFNFATT
jgi:hypothetical protein